MENTFVLNSHAPIREKRVKSKPNVPWFTSTIKKQIRERDRLTGTHTKPLEIA